MYWLGMVVVYDKASLQRFFQLFTFMSVILAAHTLFQSVTGTILLASERVDTFLSRTDVAYYQMASTDTRRIGSFFIDPNWNGAFFALAFFLPLGLFVASSSVWQKLSYLLALVLILLALLCTYSTGAWIALLMGLIVFLVFIGSVASRILFLLVGCGLAVLVFFLFPEQIALQMQHASANNELSLRIAAWQTALLVTQAYPWFGVGLGHQAYLIRSNMYRVPEQFVVLSHPHNSYLEWAAMAGIPVLCIFLVLIGIALQQSCLNWRRAEPAVKPLIGAGIASTITLSINSFSINGWTHFALALIIWPILGAVASPLLRTPDGEAKNG
ncbi:hypothetical protein KDA_00630 [Dictyobacter alpinus]|uniref:O-antigen ligase-related domain-containing protein n=2 Tax=Dictyobacter alpinus TaxID=2014873 RepID=A0A402AZM1_9CHLR|nr:hypothetical protein KDA_00630 [Dictyobacter alpinus]